MQSDRKEVIGAPVSVGQIIVDFKWKDRLLTKTLQTLVKVTYNDDLGLVDFYPCNDAAAVFVSESDQLSGSDFKRKLVRLAKAVNRKRVIVILEQTKSTSSEISSLQKFVTLELCLIAVVVSSEVEAAKYLAQMVSVEAQSTPNVFKIRSKPAGPDIRLLRSLCMVPSLGDKKARLLLEKFKSLRNICNASEEELMKVIGKGHAKTVWSFFHHKT
ncbi:C19orf40 (predicted) [Pycnogonum litorale]